MPYLLLVSLVLLAYSLAMTILRYLEYVESPEYRWRGKVLDLYDRIRPVIRRADEIEASYLKKGLTSKLVTELTLHQGIGLATVGFLQKAGIEDLSQITPSKLANIPGIGEARREYINNAMKQFVAEIRSQLHDEKSSLGRECHKEFQAVFDEARQRYPRELATLSSLEQLITEFEPKVTLARKYSFFRSVVFYRTRAELSPFVNQPFWIAKGAASSVDVPPPPPIATSPAKLPKIEPEAPKPLPLPPSIKIPSVREAEPTPVTPVPISDRDRLLAVTQYGFAIARVDGRISAAERKQIKVFLERRFAPTTELKNALPKMAEDAEKSPPEIGFAITEVKRVIASDGWSELYRFAESICDSSGERNARKNDCLSQISRSFGIDSAPTASPQSSPIATDRLPATNAECRTSLEIAPDTELSAELIRRQYRLMCERFTMDKFANLGTDFSCMAERRLRDAKHAATELLKEFNEPLETPKAPPPPTDSRFNPDLDAAFGM